MEESTESEEGSSCPPQSQSQSEGLESKEDNAKRHPQPQEDLHIIHLLAAQDLVWPLLQPKNPQKSMPKTNKRDHCMPSSNYPWPLSQPWRRQRTTTCKCSCGCQGQQVSDQTGCEVTLWHCCGQSQHPQKAYVQLAPDYDALNVANKTGFI